MKRVTVIGGGISGLATAWFLKRKCEEKGARIELTLLEKEKFTGGKIRSIREDGYLCEWGPNGFLDSKPQTLELCRALGISGRLLRSSDNARKRYIFSDGRLNRLPESPLSFLKSPLVSLPGKIRMALEPTPFIEKSPEGVDETLADFARRRLGSEALEKLIAPMVSGIFAGNPENMSLISSFPRIAELEREYGGLVRAMMKLARKKRREIAEGKVVSSAAGPGGVLTSFREGIQYLTDTLAISAGDGIRTGSAVSSITPGSLAPYMIRCEDGNVSEADIVVIAAPAYAASAILTTLDPAISSILDKIPYASMTVVSFGYERRRVNHPLDGFGYLAVKREGLSILGTLWDSSMFENRAPERCILLRSMMGGACFPGHIDLDDDEVKRRVMLDIKKTMGIDAEPDFSGIYRHRFAIPQYTVGHGERLATLSREIAKHEGLFLTGNSYRGIGLNDCVAAAARTAEELAPLL